MSSALHNPAVRALVEAVNRGDRDAFLALLTPDAELTDDGTTRDLEEWIDREIFTSNGHMDVHRQNGDGTDLTVRYRNDTWGEMNTRWHFTVTDDGRISRIETGQA